jgi:hypothetical protein
MWRRWGEFIQIPNHFQYWEFGGSAPQIKEYSINIIYHEEIE